MFWIPIAMALGGAALQLYQQDKVAERQDKQAAATIRNQASKQQTADARIAQALTAQADSNPADEMAQQTNAYIQTLQGGKQRTGYNGGVGGFSDEYRADVAREAANTDQYGRDRAGLLARMDAPILQRDGEGILFNNLRNDLSVISRDAKGQDYLDTLKLKNLKANPWLDALSQAAVGYGTANASFGGGGNANIGPVQKEILTFI